MAMQSVTDPMILDSTGQQILSALQDIAEATQPTNVYIDLEVTLPVSGWSNATPSSYTWTSEQVTTECAVEVYFANGSENVLTPYIQYEKGSQSVVFTSPAKPNANIPVIIRIINAKAESINNVTDEMVSTEVISGASNVKQALTTINSDISSLNGKLTNTTPTVTKTENIKSNSSVIAKKYGNIVSISLDVYAASTLSSYVDIASLSEAPSNIVYFIMVDSNDNAKMCRLTAGGVLQIYNTVADKNYMGHLTYIIDS